MMIHSAHRFNDHVHHEQDDQHTKNTMPTSGGKLKTHLMSSRMGPSISVLLTKRGMNREHERRENATRSIFTTNQIPNNEIKNTCYANPDTRP